MASCILCKANAIVNRQDNASRAIYNCLNCGVFVISDLVETEVKQNCAEIASFLMARKLSAASETVLVSFENANHDKGYLQLTVDQIVAAFPGTFEKQMRGTLKNLARISGYPGDEIKFTDLKYAPLFYLRKLNYDAFSYMIKALQKMEYADVNFHGTSFFPCSVVLSPKGWDIATGPDMGTSGNRQLFLLAPRQSGEVSADFAEASRKAALKLGMELVENTMLSESAIIGNALTAAIREADTVICDLTEQNPEAYYAVATAQALGKKLILTCHGGGKKKPALNPEHFPILYWQERDPLANEILNAIRAMA